MNSAEHRDESAVLTDEDLLQLQLQIAQRADQLARAQQCGRDRDADLKYWLEAERDIFARGEATTAAAGP